MPAINRWNIKPRKVSSSVTATPTNNTTAPISIDWLNPLNCHERVPIALKNRAGSTINNVPKSMPNNSCDSHCPLQAPNNSASGFFRNHWQTIDTAKTASACIHGEISWPVCLEIRISGNIATVSNKKNNAIHQPLRTSPVWFLKISLNMVTHMTICDSLDVTRICC